MEIEAMVIETLPNLNYKIEYQGKEYICYVAGKMKKAKIRVEVGDRVRVILDPYGGKNTNRITWRL